MSRRARKPWVKPSGRYVGYGNHTRFTGSYNPNNNTFTKRVRESEHLFRKLDAWAVSADHFVEELLPRNTVIIIHDAETGRMYQAPARVFAEHGRYFHFIEGGADHKAQIFLPRAFWTRTPDTSGKSRPIVDPRTLLEGSPVRDDMPAAALAPEQSAAEKAAHERDMDTLFKAL